MCGIAGVWWAGGQRQEDAETVAAGMAAQLYHRGPDARGVWADGAAGIALGHARLSILDLSPAGAQPMASASGRLVLVFNGEIYNHLELRRELEAAGAAPVWRGHSDTETLLALIEAHGLDAALLKVFGMFALGLWDRQARTLILARDRLGEKPLYYAHIADGVAFASEVKALREIGGFDTAIDKAAVAAYMRFGYIPHPHSIYRKCRKLAPGHLLRFAHPSAETEPAPWWSFASVAENGVAHRFDLSPEAVAEQTEALLAEVVRSQMLSDVPLGVFLSGGVDSSLVASLMQAQSSRPVRSFSIGFAESRFNEAGYAREVARHLHTDHTEFVVRDSDALALIPSLPDVYDEPFADSSQLPTILLSRMTRQNVTVALSGDGGDEVFGGYNRHIVGPLMWQRASRIPRALRLTAVRVLGAAQSAASGVRAERVQWLARMAGLPVTTVDKLARFADAFGRAADANEVYRSLVSNCHDPSVLLVDKFEADIVLDRLDRLPNLTHPAERWMAFDTLSYLPDDILVKVDRASMSASLETRAPFLDVRVVEHAWKLPLKAKIADGSGKRILKTILGRHIPQAMIDRPKQGFAVPLDEWLRGRLAQWAGDMLSPAALRSTGLLDPVAVPALWERHRTGRANAGQVLWSALMLQAWHEHSSDMLKSAA